MNKRIIVTFDLHEHVATVSGGCTEKYARKLLQDKLKADTGFMGGWECWISRKSCNENQVVFEISNQFASMAGIL